MHPTATTTRVAARAAVAARLRAAGVDAADLDARILLCAACAIDHLALIRDPDLALGEQAATLLSDFVRRRLAREPVSRILGRREFWGLSLAIGPGVLDPRPETEDVVTAVLEALRGRERDTLRVLDLGTGSGALLIALLHELPNAFGVGVDSSGEACRVTAHNLQALDLSHRAALVRGAWADTLAGRFDVVVSNPPYVPSADIPTLAPDVRDHDPRAALDGGRDGLDAYRALAPRLETLLAPGGVAALECGWDQAAVVAALVGAQGYSDVAVVNDLAGHGRVVVARSPHSRPFSPARRSPLRKALGERNENA